MWLGTSATSLLQVKDNIDTNTTYTLVKSGSSIQLKNQSGTVVSTVKDSDTTYSAATQSVAGLMSADDKKRLDGMEDGAQANQLAFSTITVGDTSLAADSETGTLGLVAGNNVSLSPDADNMRVTISATNTTYSNATQSAAGLMSTDDKKKLDGIASGANSYSLPTATSSVLGGVKVGSNITNSSGTISVTKDNVVAALGYTPPTTNTTYAALTNDEIDAAWMAVFG